MKQVLRDTFAQQSVEHLQMSGVNSWQPSWFSSLYIYIDQVKRRSLNLHTVQRAFYGSVYPNHKMYVLLVKMCLIQCFIEFQG